MLCPKTFSETKMANHSAAVYSRFREMVPALLRTLWEARLEYSGVGSGSDGATKVEKATFLLGRVHNTTFLLSLSALVDIYTIYSNIANNFQKVDMLVFDRLDIFNSNMEKLQKMMKTVSADSCCCSDYFDYMKYVYRPPGLESKALEVLIKESCSWPVFHSDIREMVQSATYRGVPVGCLGEEGTKTREGRLKTDRVAKLDVLKVVETVNTRADSVLAFLHTGLSKVYSSTEKAQIESVRKLLNLKFFSQAVVRSGHANTATIHFKGWVEAGKLLQPDMLIRISVEELRLQFRTFMKKLDELAPTLLNLDNKQIFSLLIHPRHRHYEGFQSVLAVMANASVVMGLESVVESWVSTMEHHNNPRRRLTQARLEQECMVAINGPTDVHCDSVVMEALANYWSRQAMAGNKQGHWVRRSHDIKQFVVSEAVDTIVNQPPDVPIMVE